DIAFGCAATVLLEDRLAVHLRDAWDQGRSALRTTPGHGVTGAMGAREVSPSATGCRAAG
ncbi:hypothetical protein ACIGEE_40825, partial [Streptomyces sp. NPDC085540]